MEPHAGTGRAHLQIERRRLGGPLLLAGELGEAVGEGIGDAEFHAFPKAIFRLCASEAIAS